jgi:hypothetical protein
MVKAVDGIFLSVARTMQCYNTLNTHKSSRCTMYFSEKNLLFGYLDTAKNIDCVTFLINILPFSLTAQNRSEVF